MIDALETLGLIALWFCGLGVIAAIIAVLTGIWCPFTKDGG